MKNVSTVGCTAFTHSSRGDGLNGDDDGGRRRNRAWAAQKREVRLEAAAAATSGLADSWTSPQGADDQLGTTAGSVQRSEGVDPNADSRPKKGKSERRRNERAAPPGADVSEPTLQPGAGLRVHVHEARHNPRISLHKRCSSDSLGVRVSFAWNIRGNTISSLVWCRKSTGRWLTE